MTFVEVWIGYAIFGTAIFSAAFIWAVRERQFSELHRGGRIPLDADRMDDADPSERRPTLVDRFTSHALAVLLAGMIALTFWVAAGHGIGVK